MICRPLDIDNTLRTIASPRRVPFRAQLAGATSTGLPLSGVEVRYLIGGLSYGTFVLSLASGPAELVIPDCATVQVATTVIGQEGRVVLTLFPEGSL